MFFSNTDYSTLLAALRSYSLKIFICSASDLSDQHSSQPAVPIKTLGSSFADIVNFCYKTTKSSMNIWVPRSFTFSPWMLKRSESQSIDKMILILLSFILHITLRLHLTRSSGPRERIRVIMDHFIYTRPLLKFFKIVNATSLPCFTYVNECYTHRHLIWDISRFI